MRKLILKLARWKIVGGFPDVKKSIVVVAPPTSYWDGLWGYLAASVLKIPFAIMADEFLFKSPMLILMKIIHAFPVNVKGKDAIHEAVSRIKAADGMHVGICPEGQLAPTDKWNPGFYHIARLAEVPIVVATLDYAKKEISFPAVITDLSDKEAVYSRLCEIYKDVTARFPEKFLLPTGNLKSKAQS